MIISLISSVSSVSPLSSLSFLSFVSSVSFVASFSSVSSVFSVVCFFCFFSWFPFVVVYLWSLSSHFFIMLLKANGMVELKIMGSPYKENPHEVAQVHTQKSAG